MPGNVWKRRPSRSLRSAVNGLQQAGLLHSREDCGIVYSASNPCRRLTRTEVVMPARQFHINSTLYVRQSGGIDGRSLASDRCVLCLQDSNGERVEQACNCQFRAGRQFCASENVEYFRKPRSEQRRIPGVTGRPSLTASARTRKQAPTDDNHGSTAAYPGKRHDFVGVTSGNLEGTI